MRSQRCLPIPLSIPRLLLQILSSFRVSSWGLSCSCPSGFQLFSPETLGILPHTMHSLEVSKGLRRLHTCVSGPPPLWLPTFWNSPFNGQLPSHPKLHHLISQDKEEKQSSQPDHFRDQEVTSGRSTSCIIRWSVRSCQLHKNFNRRDLTYSIINHVQLLYYKWVKQNSTKHTNSEGTHPRKEQLGKKRGWGLNPRLRFHPHWRKYGCGPLHGGGVSLLTWARDGTQSTS